MATIATVAGVIWHKWQTVQQNQDSLIRDKFLVSWPTLVAAELDDVLKPGELRTDLRSEITMIRNQIEGECDDECMEAIVFKNAFDVRHSTAAAFYVNCLDELGHTVKRDHEFAGQNADFRTSKTPAHLLVTHEPAGGYISHFVAHDRRKGVLIIMSWPYRVPTASRRQ